MYYSRIQNLRRKLAQVSDFTACRWHLCICEKTVEYDMSYLWQFMCECLRQERRGEGEKLPTWVHQHYSHIRMPGYLTWGQNSKPTWTISQPVDDILVFMKDRRIYVTWATFGSLCVNIQETEPYAMAPMPTWLCQNNTGLTRATSWRAQFYDRRWKLN
jgi:hypothetical protein